MKKNLKMELLNSEVENQVQGGAGVFPVDFAVDFPVAIPDGLATILMSESASAKCSKCPPGCNYYIDKRGGCGSKNADNYITCNNFEVKRGGCNGHTVIRPLDNMQVLYYM